MTKSAKIISMEYRLLSLKEQILKDAGDFPLVFLDTGAVIDFEEQAKIWKLKDKDSLAIFYDELMGSDFPLFVNKRVYQEVERHSTEYMLNGRVELSKSTLKNVKLMYHHYHNFLQNFVFENDRNIEDIRYDVYWASKLAYDLFHKKLERNPMSRTDRSLVAAAIWSRYIYLPRGPIFNDAIYGENASEKIDKHQVSSVVIVSPDDHARSTIRFLTDENHDGRVLYGNSDFLGYDGIKVISSRS